MNVYVIHYFEMREGTGEIKDKIWLNANHYFAKNFFEIRKSMIDRAVGKKPKIVEFERRGYYHTVVEEPGNEKIIYTLSMKRQKVLFADESDLTL